jgi:hypothetical protein
MVHLVWLRKLSVLIVRETKKRARRFTMVGSFLTRRQRSLRVGVEEEENPNQELVVNKMTINEYTAAELYPLQPDSKCSRG